ncbi:carboxymuconolactone decarboxylase family protein [Uniformispora flossi]|uniref:carboxymuconolactone decarboxylase family protein n=1 Tax=Uniformispora flossi TaxID=3390723 RepID=UPI003C2D6A6B
MAGWLSRIEAEATDFPGTLGLFPELRTSYADYFTRLWNPGVLDPRTTELVRLRIAQLHECETELAVRTRPAVDAGLDDAKVAALAKGGGDPAFDAVESACLDFAEQFVMAPGGVSDEDRTRLTELLGMPRVVGLAMACAVFDGFARFNVVLGTHTITPGTGVTVAELPGLDPAAPATPPPTDPADPIASSPFALQPDLLASFLRLYGTLWSNGVVDHASKEVARLRNARVTDCRFCRAVRYDQATAAGLTEDFVELIDDGFEASALQERHKTVIRLADVFLGNPHGVTDELRNELVAAYGAAGTVELTAGLALFMGFSKIAVSLGTIPEGLPTRIPLPTPRR